MQLKIHVIDHDYRRRMRIVREFADRAIHAEIYDGLAEFVQRVPDQGCIFAFEDEAASARELVASLQSSGAGLPVVIYSESPEPPTIVDGMLAGAVDYLQWPFEAEVLDAALARLAADGKRHTLKEKLRLDARGAVIELSPREREILTLMTRGMSNKDMAAALDLSPRTIELHRKNMMRRLNARSPSDAVRIAIYAGLDEPEGAQGRTGATLISASNS